MSISLSQKTDSQSSQAGSSLTLHILPKFLAKFCLTNIRYWKSLESRGPVVKVEKDVKVQDKLRKVVKTLGSYWLLMAPGGSSTTVGPCIRHFPVT